MPKTENEIIPEWKKKKVPSDIQEFLKKAYGLYMYCMGGYSDVLRKKCKDYFGSNRDDDTDECYIKLMSKMSEVAARAQKGGGDAFGKVETAGGIRDKKDKIIWKKLKGDGEIWKFLVEYEHKKAKENDFKEIWTIKVKETMNKYECAVVGIDAPNSDDLLNINIDEEIRRFEPTWGEIDCAMPGKELIESRRQL